jgi:hypothetical protein
MCLDKLENFNLYRRYGWKMFREEYKGELHPIYKYPDSLFEENTWISDYIEFNITAFSGITYPCGFHLYVCKRVVQKYIVGMLSITWRKVYYKNVVAKGYEDGRKVIVARDIFVCDQNESVIPEIGEFA